MAKNDQICFFSQTHLDIVMILVKTVCSFFNKILLFMKTMSLNILTKLCGKRRRCLANAVRADERGGGVGEMLTMADKGGRGYLDPPSWLK